MWRQHLLFILTEFALVFFRDAMLDFVQSLPGMSAFNPNNVLGTLCLFLALAIYSPNLYRWVRQKIQNISQAEWHTIPWRARVLWCGVGTAVSSLFFVLLSGSPAPPTNRPDSGPLVPHETPTSQRDVTRSWTSLTALELMDIVTSGGEDAVQSQIGLSIQVQGPFLNVAIMPSGFDFKRDRKPSTLAALWMVVLAWDPESALENMEGMAGLPEKVVYVYVDSTYEREVAMIPDRTEVIAIGTIQEIGSYSLTIGDATIISL